MPKKGTVGQVRNPVVAGRFYSASEEGLKKELKGLIADRKEQIDAIGVISPHAGYACSGCVAGELFPSIKQKSTYIILGPNHTGYGKRFGLDAERSWKTPLGEVKINKKIAGEILERSEYIEKDTTCHDLEHSIEVQLPFLQYLNKDFTFVPIVISARDPEAYKKIGRELAGLIGSMKDKPLIIASSDMTHYEPDESAKKKDKMAIDRILKLDLDGFLDTVAKYRISMCGLGPAAIMLEAAIMLGAKKAKLIKYATSGDVLGDYSSVVGYAGVAIY